MLEPVDKVSVGDDSLGVGIPHDSVSVCEVSLKSANAVANLRGRFVQGVRQLLFHVGNLSSTQANV